jgi:hypothetical protein
MTARARRWIVAAATLTPLVIPGSALAQESPFTVHLENMVPGVPQSESFTYQLSEDAVFRGETWTEQDGVLQLAALDVVVCAPGGACVDGDDPDDTVLPAGPITVTVTATIDSETPQGSSGTASGELLFAAADGDDDDPELPFTGAWLMEMAAWAAAAISIGTLIVAMTRRDDAEEPLL